jgi:hypothetical protein
MHPTVSWQPYIPLLVIGVLLVVRLRRVNKARPMHLWRLAVGPGILGLAAIYLAVSVPPDLAGVAIFAGAAGAGAALGWQRARLMKIAFDPATNSFTLQQSPWALALLIGVMLLRRLLLPSAAAMQGGGGHSQHAMWLIDGLIGFGLGTIVAQNTELWLRARALRVAAVSGTFA